MEVLDSLESSHDTVVYALDETKVGIESDNHYSWSPVGAPPILEKNGSHSGINLIGSTSVLKDFHTVVDVYSNKKSIKSDKVIKHLDYLMQINSGKNVVVFLDNAKMHTSAAIEKYYLGKKDILKLIYLPKYSPNMNPQENIWNHLKAKLYKPSSRSCIEELILDTKNIFDDLNLNTEKIYSLAYARQFLV